ncbi:MerR family transcriptional regulator [Motiliproteus sediminis]|uniref:MerR family transcriptional regulator n=1 Tax=Motiliproteus sediminis TaxID=1468178 RepID=UPI001AEF78A5|nr:MerR family transcriptional regulator [Motiliproteus sediminis]
MNMPPVTQYTIDEVSRDIGIGKDTLRVWERRYGFPVPGRGPQGERVYSRDQVKRLRIISRLLDRGYRPGKVVSLSDEQLQELALQQQLGQVNFDHPRVGQLLLSAQAGENAQVEPQLRSLYRELGPQRFVTEVAAPLLDMTGRAWAAGQLSIFVEHLVTDHLSRVLHDACHQIQPPEDGPRVLLTTMPGERHGMGLLMVELMLREGGARTVNLGVEMPVDELILACKSLQPEVVALSFSALQKRSLLMAALREISSKLPASVQILVGGEGVSRLRMLPGRVTVVRQLDAIAPVVAALHDRVRH